MGEKPASNETQLKVSCTEHDEQERQRELASFQILDTPPEIEFDDFTHLATQICDTPIALISLLDPDRQWFKSRVGVEVSETPRSMAFCNYALACDDVFEVPDAQLDPRFQNNPLVLADPFIRFYAGAPLKTSSGNAIGTLCVIDRVPRVLTHEQQAALRMLSREVVTRLELRRANSMLKLQVAFQEAILTSAGAGIITTTSNGIITHFNPQAERMLGFSAVEMIGRETPEIFHDRHEIAARATVLTDELKRPVAPGFDVFVEKARSIEGFVDTSEWTYVRKDGSRFPVLLSVSALRERGGRLIGFLGIARDITERKKLEADLLAQASTIKRQKELLSEIRTIQDLFITNQGGKECFDRLLVTLLRYTESERGALCDVRYSPAGEPSLKAQSCVQISRKAGARNPSTTNMESTAECPELLHIMKKVLVTGATVSDGEARCLQVGEPEDRQGAVVAIPIYNRKELVGVLGLARAAGAYPLELLEEIQPLITTYANLILARRTFLSRNVAEQRVKAQDVLLTHKQTLLQEVHHRVKNNLQIISSLLSLQISQTKNLDVVEQLKTARARISAVAMLHEVLYRSDTMECVDLARFLGELRNGIRAAFGQSASHITVEVDAPSTVGLTHDQAGPLALIVNELATNAIKHAFVGRDSGRVQIRATVRPRTPNGSHQDLWVEVEDDGRGYENEHLTGLGGRIADRLTAQLGGTLCRQPLPQGTRWELTVPLGDQDALYEAPASH
jgi:two-component sensor histidine kinase/PAS domain-containing protein